MRKSRILYQIMACILISLTYIVINAADAPALHDKSASAVATVSKHYTMQDIAAFGGQAVSSLVKAPAAVTSYIISSQEQQKYGIPLDETKTGETAPVYAAAGGKVVEIGENEVLGKYIIISHDDKISTYGNCDRIYVEEHEHVRKGQVVASFTNDGSKTFLYDLKDRE